MKTRFSKTCFAFLIASLFTISGFAQVATVGVVRNGNATVTNLADATAVLKGGLSASATVSDVYIELEPSSGKYFLFGRISNDRVSGKAVELNLESNTLRAKGGPGIEVTCSGSNCSACVPKITNWKVKCVCEDNPLRSDWQCDMTSKVIVTPW